MKKLLLFSTLICATYGYSQSNQISFDTQLIYKINTDSNGESVDSSVDGSISDAKKYFISHYVSNKSNSSFIEITGGYSPLRSLFNSGRIIDISDVSIDGTLNVSPSALYSFNTNIELAKAYNSNFDFVKMNKKGSFNGFSCEYYSVKVPVETDAIGVSDGISEDVCFCLDTKNVTKNLKTFLPNASIDGLVVAILPTNSDVNYFELKEIKKNITKINFDFDSEYEKLRVAYEEMIKESEADLFSEYAVDTSITDFSDYHDDPLCYNYSYFENLDTKTRYFSDRVSDMGCILKTQDVDYDGEPDMTRAQAISIAEKQAYASIKEAKKNKVLSKTQAKDIKKAFNNMFADAKKYVPSDSSNNYDYPLDVVAEEAIEVYDDFDYSFYTKYASDYKTTTTTEINLAAESQEMNDTVSLNMPDYCTKLKANVPNFNDKALKTQVYNLVGQICDLYLYQNGGNVDYFGTINSMRMSLLEIENKRVSITKEDAKLLKDYLNSLD